MLEWFDGLLGGILAIFVRLVDGLRALADGEQEGLGGAPAVLAARAIAEGRFEPRGLVPPNKYVDADELLGYLRTIGVETVPI